MFRIVMFAPCFAPYEASENLCNSKLALAFLARGLEVDVVSRADSGFMYSIGWQEPWLPLKAITHEVVYEGCGRVGGMADAFRQGLRLGHPVEGTRWAGRALDIAVRLHARKPYDLALSRAPNEVGHLPAMHFARRTGVPWIANWNDPPCYSRPAPYMYEGGFLRKAMLKRLVGQVLRRASLNTFPCARLRDYVLDAEKADVPSTVIPHIALPVSVRETGPGRRGGPFRLCHAGHLAKEQATVPLIEALARFRKECGDFTFDIMGFDNSGMSAAAESLGVGDCVRLLGPMPYGEIMRRLPGYDALLAIEPPLDEGILLLSKLSDYAHSGRPILAVSPLQGTTSDLVAKHGGGLAADCRSADGIFGALHTLHEARNDETLDERYGSCRLYEAFSPDRVIDEYMDVFRGLNADARRG